MIFEQNVILVNLESTLKTQKLEYDLTTKIANTYGPEGFLIVGFDDKTKKFSDSIFSDWNYSNNVLNTVGIVENEIPSTRGETRIILICL